MTWFHRHYFIEAGFPYWPGYFYDLSKAGSLLATESHRHPDISFTCHKCGREYVGWSKL